MNDRIVKDLKPKRHGLIAVIMHRDLRGVSDENHERFYSG
jgi:hypothetical protein